MPTKRTTTRGRGGSTAITIQIEVLDRLLLRWWLWLHMHVTMLL
jgi:hypothetical protein